jgi:hypothetical protein
MVDEEDGLQAIIKGIWFPTGASSSNNNHNNNNQKNAKHSFRLMPIVAGVVHSNSNAEKNVSD